MANVIYYIMIWGFTNKGISAFYPKYFIINEYSLKERLIWFFNMLIKFEFIWILRNINHCLNRLLTTLATKSSDSQCLFINNLMWATL